MPGRRRSSSKHEYNKVEQDYFKDLPFFPPCRIDICIERALLWVSRANISGQMTHVTVTKEHSPKIGYCTIIELEKIVRKER